MQTLNPFCCCCRPGCVEGVDDPRLPTLRGLMRHGLHPDALKAFLLQQVSWGHRVWLWGRGGGGGERGLTCIQQLKLSRPTWLQQARRCQIIISCKT